MQKKKTLIGNFNMKCRQKTERPLIQCRVMFTCCQKKKHRKIEVFKEVYSVYVSVYVIPLALSLFFCQQFQQLQLKKQGRLMENKRFQDKHRNAAWTMARMKM